MAYLKIAYRNLFRNRRRTAITASVIVFGCTALVIAGGFIESMFDGLREATISMGLGHLQIYNEKFLDQEEDRPLELGLDDWEQIAAGVSKIEHVRQITPRIDFTGLLSNGEKSVVFLGTGVNPQAERDMGFQVAIREGRDLLPATDGAPEVLLATGLAKSLNAHLGDSLTLLTTTADGALNGIDVTVCGIVTTGFAEYDARALTVTVDSAGALLETSKVSKLVVLLDRTENTDTAFAALQGLLTARHWPLRIKKWIELATFYNQVVTWFTAIFAFLGIIIFVLVVLSSSNTMMMAVMERVREIGTLMAFGTARTKVIWIHVLEGALLGTLGGLLGLGVAWLGILVINAANMVMPAPPGSTEGFPIVVYKVPAIFVSTLLLMTVTLTISSVVPAVKASRLKIIDALNHS